MSRPYLVIPTPPRGDWDDGVPESHAGAVPTAMVAELRLSGPVGDPSTTSSPGYAAELFSLLDVPPPVAAALETRFGGDIELLVRSELIDEAPARMDSGPSSESSTRIVSDGLVAPPNLYVDAAPPDVEPGASVSSRWLITLLAMTGLFVRGTSYSDSGLAPRVSTGSLAVGFRDGRALVPVLATLEPTGPDENFGGDTFAGLDNALLSRTKVPRLRSSLLLSLESISTFLVPSLLAPKRDDVEAKGS
jgi:hypothetical protein